MPQPAGFAARFPVLSLRQTLMLGVALGILLPALFLAYFQVTAKLQTEVALRVEAPMRQYAEVLSRGMAVAVWNLDRGVASELVDAVMRNPDVVSVTVTDEFQDVFVRKHNDNLSPGATLNDQRDIIYNGTRVGRLTVEMTSQRIEREMRQDLLRFALALVLQMALAFLVIWPLFNRRVLKPLLELREDARRLARGELALPLSPQRKDEMGELAHALDTMRMDLAALMAEREHKTQALQQELTERARTEEALRVSQTKFKAIFDASPVSMSVSRVGDDIQTMDVNSAWVRVFGIEREVAMGTNGIRTGIWKDVAQRHEAMRLLQEEGELIGYRAWMLHGVTRAEMLCELSGRMVTLGGERVLIMAFDDITAKHRYEENILQLNATLEHRVQDRTQELSTTLAQLTAAQSELVRAEKMSALGSLVAGIAHELNTPIGNSLTVASTLQDHANTFANSMAQGLTRSRLEEFVGNTRQGAGILMRGLQHAAELVSSFKQVAVDQTSLNRRSFDLQATVSEILLTLGPTIRKSNHQVESDIADGIVMDSYPGPLGQVLTNLINNALLHAFEGVERGTVRVSASLTSEGAVRLMVRDNGAGIPAAHLPRVFDPFFTTKLGQGGSGLGLNIVYNLVTKSLGGTVHVASSPGEGATFSMVLPRLAPAVAFDPSEPEALAR
ncbi:MAG: ATP-binding protein [Rhodoferax sp.]|nr:ATP-binding protein [Rhodoferax sp.]